MRNTCRFVCLALAIGASACGPREPPAGPAAPVPSPLLGCVGEPSVVTWDWAASRRATLDRWCESVGPPAVVSAASPLEADIRQLIVVSWNVHVGGGRLSELVTLIRERTASADNAQTGIVLLLQEAFRGGPIVTEVIPRGLDVPAAIRPNRPAPDVVQLAKSLNLSLAYVPSMRNGRATSVYEREDRGSAVLSSEPLSEVRAIELPFGRQRRVAVMATVRPRGSRAMPLVVVAGHFDAGSARIRQADALVQRIASLTEPNAHVVIGLDTNATFGNRDGGVRSIGSAFPVEPCGTGRTGPWLARLDFIFSNLPRSIVQGCETLLDRYGSDHRPLVLTLQFTPPDQPPRENVLPRDAGLLARSRSAARDLVLVTGGRRHHR